VAYRLADGDTDYRLVTTLLDARRHPARELAALYAQRWEIETVFAELKTHQRGAQVVLASKTPDGVLQQIWAHLLVHHALRELMRPDACAASPRSSSARCPTTGSSAPSTATGNSPSTPARKPSASNAPQLTSQ
jgi:hypothetical protein